MFVRRSVIWVVALALCSLALDQGAHAFGRKRKTVSDETCQMFLLTDVARSGVWEEAYPKLIDKGYKPVQVFVTASNYDSQLGRLREKALVGDLTYELQRLTDGVESFDDKVGCYATFTLNRLSHKANGPELGAIFHGKSGTGFGPWGLNEICGAAVTFAMEKLPKCKVKGH